MTEDYFTDDDASIFEEDINRLAASGISRRDAALPLSVRGNRLPGRKWPHFLVRGLGYTGDGGGDLFEDDDSSIFESDIDKFATAGVTLGCNPPGNTNVCHTRVSPEGKWPPFFGELSRPRAEGSPFGRSAGRSTVEHRSTGYGGVAEPEALAGPITEAWDDWIGLIQVDHHDIPAAVSQICPQGPSLRCTVQEGVMLGPQVKLARRQPYRERVTVGWDSLTLASRSGNDETPPRND